MLQVVELWQMFSLVRKLFVWKNFNFLDGLIQSGWMKEGYNFYDYYGSIHLTYCFNIMILFQIFNMINCKDLHSKKSIFNSFKDGIFVRFFILSLVLHFLVVTFSSRMFRVSLWVSSHHPNHLI